jgi:O-antigen/teichoic acid export membrane protein
MADHTLSNVASDNANSLTRGSLLTRNTIINLIGQGAPLIVAIFAIPMLIRSLGTDRFGVLTIAWMIIGYFSLFELGLGRALTKLLAEKLGIEQEQELSRLVWTALFLMLILGLLGMLTVILLAPWLVQNALKIPQTLQSETLQSFYLLAISVPVVISTAGLRGLLEAYQRFDLINAVRIPIGMFTFLGPLLVLPFSKHLLPIVTVLVAGRLIAWVVYLFLCFYIMPSLRLLTIRKEMVGPLLSCGSWMTVTNIVGPIMVYFDRFLIGVLISITAVAYYATPYEVITKLGIIAAGALAGVLFPAFSTSFTQDRRHAAILFMSGVKYLFLALFPIILVIVMLGYEGLEFWLGIEFAQNSTCVLQWLAIGVFVNSLAHIPFALIQGAGRPDLTAKLHLVELPFYLLAVWWLIGAYGIEGAAIAWVVRAVFDALILFAIAARFLPCILPMIWRIALIVILCGLIMGIAVLTEGIIMKLIILFFILFFFILFSWVMILAPWERTFLKNKIRIK